MSTTRQISIATEHRTGGDRVSALAALFSDPGMDRPTKLSRLQGWRGADLEQAAAAGVAHRVGPAICGSLALIAAVSGSTLVLAVTLITTAIGIGAANHPAESIYNRVAARWGRTPLPPNRAAKRLACALGTAFLAAAWLAAGFGLTTLSTVLLVMLGSLALFVAATGICVPSIMFTLMFGADAGTRRQLMPGFNGR